MGDSSGRRVPPSETPNGPATPVAGAGSPTTSPAAAAALQATGGKAASRPSRQLILQLTRLPASVLATVAGRTPPRTLPAGSSGGSSAESSSPVATLAARPPAVASPTAQPQRAGPSLPPASQDDHGEAPTLHSLSSRLRDMQRHQEDAACEMRSELRAQRRLLQGLADSVQHLLLQQLHVQHSLSDGDRAATSGTPIEVSTDTRQANSLELDGPAASPLTVPADQLCPTNGPVRKRSRVVQKPVAFNANPAAKRSRKGPSVQEERIVVPPNIGSREFVQIQPCACYRKTAQFERCAKCRPLIKTSARGRDKLIDEVCCSFTGFRKLRVELGQVVVSGYLAPYEASKSVMELYQPSQDSKVFTVEQANFILAHIGFPFLKIASEERKLLQFKKASWKRISKCREMCDACVTTLFNAHYVCIQCGLAICPTCWMETNTPGARAIPWAYCHKNRVHRASDFILTQVLPGSVLQDTVQQLESIQKPTVSPHQLSLPESYRLPFQDSSLLFIKGSATDEMPEACLAAFREEWAQGKPVVVAGVHRKLKQDWTSQGLSSIAEGTNQLADVVDCTGCPNKLASVEDFWLGFEKMDARLPPSTASRGEALPNPLPPHPPLYKLKDWPSKDEFCCVMPDHYQDLMSSLPFASYTHHDGVFNLIARLPTGYVKPDLGPKMYIAYGTTLLLRSTTNLHVDISDAVNILVNVTEPTARPDCELACNYREQELAEIATIVARQEPALQAHCAENTPGALWHIYSNRDKEKVRAFLKKVFAESHVKMTDPIHDQNIYLDATLRQRLKDEEGVVGWEFVQCRGDAVFIPAGAPHQVQNLNSCIKAAEDFVSPEHVEECLKLTSEFRHLTSHHTNREDKLQIKNIIFHSVKDAMACVSQPAALSAPHVAQGHHPEPET